MPCGGKCLPHIYYYSIQEIPLASTKTKKNLWLRSKKHCDCIIKNTHTPHSAVSNDFSSSLFPIRFRLIILAASPAGCWRCRRLSNARLLALIYVIGIKFLQGRYFTHSLAHCESTYFFIAFKIGRTLCCLFEGDGAAHIERGLVGVGGRSMMPAG